MNDTYDGSNSPSRISPLEKNGGILKISWDSDFSVTNKGWKLCPDATGPTSGLGFVQQKVQQRDKAIKEEHEEEKEVGRKIQQTHAAMKEKHEEKEQRYWPMPAPSPWPAYDQHYWPMPAPAPSPWPVHDQHYWPMPAPAPPALSFHVDSGSCKVDVQTGCVTSPSYPSHYSDNQACSFTASGKGTFSAKDFQTERGYDKLLIMNETYDGSNSPSRISPLEKNGGILKISWASDFSVTNKGWKLCPDATGPTSGLGFVQQKVQQRDKAIKEEHEEEKEVGRKIQQTHAAMKKKHEEKEQRQVQQTRTSIKGKNEDKHKEEKRWAWMAPAPVDQHYWPMPAPSPWPAYD